MIVDQVDDLTMVRRQSGQCPAQQFAPILFLQCDFRVVRRIRDGGLDFFVQFGAFCSPPTCRQGLMASNRIIVMALRTEGSHRYSWTKNRRSPFVSWTRPRTLR